MLYHPDYCRATNAAYETLLMHAPTPKTDVLEIARKLPNCKVISYSTAVRRYPWTEKQLIEQSADGFSIKLSTKSGYRTIILYNDHLSETRMRFTIAHEIGHFVLQHTEENNPDLEKEANCFARNLLCPVPLIASLHADTIDRYAFLFSVSRDMAAYAIRNGKSDRFYLSKDLLASLQARWKSNILGNELRKKIS